MDACNGWLNETTCQGRVSVKGAMEPHIDHHFYQDPAVALCSERRVQLVQLVQLTLGLRVIVLQYWWRQVATCGSRNPGMLQSIVWSVIPRPKSLPKLPKLSRETLPCQAYHAYLPQPSAEQKCPTKSTDLELVLVVLVCCHWRLCNLRRLLQQLHLFGTVRWWKKPLLETLHQLGWALEVLVPSSKVEVPRRLWQLWNLWCLPHGWQWLELDQ